MASDEIKSALVDHYRDLIGVETRKSDWKRTAKRSISTCGGDQVAVREFANSAAGITAVVSGESYGGLTILTLPKILYAIDTVSDPGSVLCCFSGEDYFLRHGTPPDQYMSEVLAYLGLSSDFEELGDNTFATDPNWPEAKIRAHMSSLGFVEEPKLVW